MTCTCNCHEVKMYTKTLPKTDTEYVVHHGLQSQYPIVSIRDVHGYERFDVPFTFGDGTVIFPQGVVEAGIRLVAKL